METIPTTHFLIVAAIIFLLGLATVLSKKNVVAVLLGIELMLNACNLNLVAFSRSDQVLQGQMFSLFVMVVAASEIAVALAILISAYNHYKTSNIESISQVKE